jgi:hypothetical protein
MRNLSPKVEHLDPERNVRYEFDVMYVVMRPRDKPEAVRPDARAEPSSIHYIASPRHVERETPIIPAIGPPKPMSRGFPTRCNGKIGIV